jgi:DNA-binding CsgD family transcriptional regulator
MINIEKQIAETHRSVELSYKNIIARYAPLSDPHYLMSEPKRNFLQQLARTNNQTLALCNRGSGIYNFLHLRNNDYSQQFEEKVEMIRFLRLMHPDDLEHFQKAWQFVESFIQSKHSTRLINYALVFECRLKDDLEQYQRVIFKYKIILEDNEKRGQLLLFLRSVDGAIRHIPHREIYVIDVRNKTYVYSGKENVISNREKEVIQLSQKGLDSKEIAQKLFVSDETIRMHRKNAIRKLALKDTGSVACYLMEMGVM